MGTPISTTNNLTHTTGLVSLKARRTQHQIKIKQKMRLTFAEPALIVSCSSKTARGGSAPASGNGNLPYNTYH
jgi:hypothetical protein